jgi:hypothetical protein
MDSDIVVTLKKYLEKKYHVNQSLTILNEFFLGALLIEFTNLILSNVSPIRLSLLPTKLKCDLDLNFSTNLV